MLARPVDPAAGAWHRLRDIGPGERDVRPWPETEQIRKT